MKNNAYRKSILRELHSSKARFISILIIILLGVAFYSGIKATGPNMKQEVEGFYEEHGLMDSKIVSTLGLSDKDLELLNNNDRILSYYGSHTIDSNLTNLNNVIRFMEYDKETYNGINSLAILEGRLPENSGEIALDEQMVKDNPNLKIGDTYTIECDKNTMESFKRASFEIVGVVKSPMYIERYSKGTTSVGKGTIDYFAIINSLDISMSAYTEIYVKFKDVQGLEAYSDEYKEKMEVNNEYLKSLYSGRAIERIEELKNDAYEEINKGYEELEKGEKELLDAQNAINDGKSKLEDGKNQYEEAIKTYNTSIEQGQLMIALSEKQIIDGQSELDKQKETITNAKEQLDNAKKELDNAQQELANQGVNPNQNIDDLKNKVNGLNSLVMAYNNLSNDIKDTVDNIENGNGISDEKINLWKATIKNLGLNDFEALINSLEENPSDTAIALEIANEIDAIRNTVNTNISNLNILVDSLTKYQGGKAQYEEQVKNINNAQAQIYTAQGVLNTGKAELVKAKDNLEQSKIEGEKELEKAKRVIDDSEVELLNGEKEITKNNIKLIDAKKELKEAEKQLSELDKGKYYFFDRNDNPGYSEFLDVVKRMDAIATVFPMFFFVVAVLICLTTMTRMVEENRVEIGTLKALGYTNVEIAKKYIIYAALASIIGSILGVIIGFNLFPNIIYTAYSTMYTLPTLNVVYYPSFIIQSMLISNLCTVGAVLVVLKVDLNSDPAMLMRPKAPKVGKRILLERITFIWNRLNFNQKVTCRNLFRYKQRMIMTVFGIAACTAMIITGFGLKDSIGGLTTKQFDKLWKYQALVIFKDEPTVEDDEAYNTLLNNLNEYKGSLNIHQEMVTFTKENMNKQTVSLFVPESNEELKNFVLLNDRVSGEEYTLSDDGVVINEKLAKLLDVSVGDIIKMHDEDNNEFEIKVSNISEGYLTHSLYMSEKYYKEIFSKEVTYNSQLMKLNISDTNEDSIASKLMESDKVINVTLSSYLADAANETMGTLNIVVVILIISAGGLALVVLYNLNNINVSERIRELSTIKVLGFYDMEVTMYILRENTILTALGILCGMFMGKILHGFVIVTAEADSMMMSPNIYPISFIYSIVLTLLFSFIVMIMMHSKLKKVNMIDALKSNE